MTDIFDASVAEYHDRQSYWVAAAEMAHHEVLGESYWNGGARWLVGVPGSNNFRFEVIVGTMGSVLVHGDIPTCRFAFVSGGVWSRLRWLSDVAQPAEDLGYLAEKAAQGCGGRESSYEYNAAVARGGLDDVLLEYADDTELDEDDRDIIREARDHTESREGLYEYLHMNGEWLMEGYISYELGNILSFHVVVGHMAIMTTVSLLAEKYGNNGPPMLRQCHPSVQQHRSDMIIELEKENTQLRKMLAAPRTLTRAEMDEVLRSANADITNILSQGK